MKMAEKEDRRLMDGQTLRDVYEDLLKMRNKKREKWTFEDFLNEVGAKEIGPKEDVDDMEGKPPSKMNYRQKDPDISNEKKLAR